MKIQVQKAAERGTGNFGWLKPNYYFSFSNYYNPEQVQFGLLRVLNDDWIGPGGAFPAHPHENMEIVTIPLSGALKHQDSSGGQGVIKAGDVQIMSAGTGVRHSEANDSINDPVTLFQIWVFPKERNIEPRYDQKTFDVAERDNKWQIVVSPKEEDKALWINQDARFALTNIKAGNTITYSNGFEGNGAYVVVINGKVEIDGVELSKRDAAGIEGTDSFTINASEDAEILVVEVPMN